jgi:hypothetical protein
MTREALADRIITYSDALVAFSLVNALAFLIALAEPEIRCSINRIAWTIAIVNLAFPLTSSTILVALRRFELKLREGEHQDEMVTSFWNYARIVRYALVWGFAAMVLLGLLGANSDPACADLSI